MVGILEHGADIPDPYLVLGSPDSESIPSYEKQAEKCPIGQK